MSQNNNNKTGMNLKQTAIIVTSLAAILGTVQITIPPMLYQAKQESKIPNSQEQFVFQLVNEIIKNQDKMKEKQNDDYKELKYDINHLNRKMDKIIDYFFTNKK